MRIIGWGLAIAALGGSGAAWALSCVRFVGEYAELELVSVTVDGVLQEDLSAWQVRSDLQADDPGEIRLTVDGELWRFGGAQ